MFGEDFPRAVAFYQSWEQDPAAEMGGGGVERAQDMPWGLGCRGWDCSVEVERSITHLLLQLLWAPPAPMESAAVAGKGWP